MPAIGGYSVYVAIPGDARGPHTVRVYRDADDEHIHSWEGMVSSLHATMSEVAHAIQQDVNEINDGKTPDMLPVAAYLRQMAPAAPTYDGGTHHDNRRNFLEAAKFLEGAKLNGDPHEGKHFVVYMLPVFVNDIFVGHTRVVISLTFEGEVLVNSEFRPWETSNGESTSEEPSK